MIEVVVTDNDSQRFTACGSVLVLIEFFEYGTLIPGCSPEFFKGFSEQLFGDVEYSYLEVSRGVGGGNKIIESAPYSIDLQVRIIRVERDGRTKNMDGGNGKPSRQKPIEFQFTIEAGAFHLLIVDDEWYWTQRMSDSLRVKMAKYVDIQNAYCSEMARIGDEFRNKKQYNKAEGISLRDSVVDKYRQLLLDAISEFVGKKIELPPECVPPAKIEKEDDEERNRPYQSLHDEDDDAMSELDMLSYRTLANRGNRFKEYAKEIEKQEEEIKKQKELDRVARREELRLKGPGELNGSRGIGVSGRGRDGRKEKLRLKGPGEFEGTRKIGR